MTEINNSTTFVGLLTQCSRIEIPQIQRDFAQGREEQLEVRDEFLSALRAAFETGMLKQSSPMNLDFIYGSMEEDSYGKYFLPLDGQQRLTTLFLLHWYLAWRDGQLSDFKTKLWDGRRARFTYRVRPSSNEFFDELTIFKPDLSPDSVESVRKYLEDQHWFFLNWELDPTIQSVLTMLNAIHEKFKDMNGFYLRLIDDQNPVITFQLLQLENFGLSDDLYIKMNARGKPLTPFETFKARFEEDLKILFPDLKWDFVGREWSTCDFFAHKMDTQWTNFFWNYKSYSSKTIDADVMNLIGVVAQLSLNPDRDDFLSATSFLQNKQTNVNYSLLKEKNLLTIEFTNFWISLLDSWSFSEGALVRQISDARYFDEEVIFQKAVKSSSALNYSELLQFSAFVFYINQWKGNIHVDEFQDWMRIVSNLASNTNFDHVEVFQRCMGSLRKLLPESRRILNYFAEIDHIRLLGFSPQQVQEEVLKAKLILADGGWRQVIESAETHPYFNGQIEFLLEFSGLRNLQADDLLEINHKNMQALFGLYFAKASLTFGREGLLEPDDAIENSYLWERALLSVGDYMLPIGSNYSFGANVADRPDSWKRLLRAGSPDADSRRAYIKSLWDRIHISDDIKKQLEFIIEGAGHLESWRKIFVENPNVIKYCQNKEIRKVDGDRVYLLKRRQMNGAHAELFSYSFYLKEVESLGARLRNLNFGGYKYAYDSSVEPHVPVSCAAEDHVLDFAIESCSHGFKIIFKSVDSEFHMEAALISEMGFIKINTELCISCDRENIVDVLFKLDNFLSKVIT